jgi:hypothetical protein
MSRSIAVAVAGLLLLTATAHGSHVRLRSAASLEAVVTGSATGPIVRLQWRDRARGETRWEVLRRPKRTILKANRRRFTDRRVRAGKVYRYLVRPCRRARCAKAASVRVRVGMRDAPPTGAPYAGSPRIGGCPVFPKNNPWNSDISGFPVHPMSDAYVGSFGSLTLWPDFGSGVYGDFGMPYGTVPLDQPLVPIRFQTAESDPGPYPIPPNARVEAAAQPDGDHHVVILRLGDCHLFELYDAKKQPDNGWSAYSAAKFDLRSNALRSDGHTSADAAGLPILPGLARLDEVQAGAIQHALRITIPRTQNAYIHPATHAASSSTNPALPPMGLRLRLRSTYDISALYGQARVIARALQVYGALVADNTSGSRVFISGTPDPGWNDNDLNQLKRIPASALEAVETGPLHPG